MNETIKIRLDTYLTEMRTAPKESVPQIRAQFATWYRSLTEEEQAQTRPFWQGVKESAQAAIEEINEAMQELKTLTDAKLVVGKQEYSLREWLTISEYSRRHNLKVSRVQNWIKRGVVPPDNVVVVTQLNGVKLIKNEVYGTGSLR
jgi:predicted Zn-dependent peptidase